MGKKKSVVKDDLDIKAGGIYCVTPYSKKDSNASMIFKIGQTSSFSQRLTQYSGYFPLGVYMVAFLESPPVRLNTRAVRTTKKSHYEKIEKEVIESIILKGGVRIYSTDRVRNDSSNEWVYTTEKIIGEVFREVEAKYKGNLHLFSLGHINMQHANNLKKKNPKYVAEIVFDVTPPTEN